MEPGVSVNIPLEGWRNLTAMLLPVLAGVFCGSVAMAVRGFLPKAPADLKARGLAYLYTALSAFPAWVSLFALTRVNASPAAGRAYAILFLCATPVAWGVALSGLVQVSRLAPDSRSLERIGLLWYHRILVFGPFLVILGCVAAAKIVQLRS